MPKTGNAARSLIMQSGASAQLTVRAPVWTAPAGLSPASVAVELGLGRGGVLLSEGDIGHLARSVYARGWSDGEIGVMLGCSRSKVQRLRTGAASEPTPPFRQLGAALRLIASAFKAGGNPACHEAAHRFAGDYDAAIGGLRALTDALDEAAAP